MRQQIFSLLALLVLQLLYTNTNGLQQIEPQITLYYSDKRHTYRAQSASNYLEIPTATINIRLTCEGSDVTWISPESDNIRDNLWGTLTIELLTAAETGLYKCNGAEGTSSIYISAIGLGMYTIRSDRDTPERLYPGRNYFIEDTRDVTHKFFCLMSNPYSTNVPTWKYPKYVTGTPNEDSYIIEHDASQAMTSLSVKEDNWNILLSGRYTCVGEDADGVVTNVSLNIWSHATPILRTTTYSDNVITTEHVLVETGTTFSHTESNQPTHSAANTDFSVEGIDSTDQEVSTSTYDESTTVSTGILNREDVTIKVGFALALLTAIVGWTFSVTAVCCLWCCMRRRRRRRGLKRNSYKTSERSLSYKENNEKPQSTYLKPPNNNNNFSFNSYYPCTIRDFEKEPSPAGSSRLSRSSTPTYRVQSQEMLI